MGDFNCKSPAWNCGSSNIDGKVLLEYIVAHQLSLAAPNSTTHPNRSSDVNPCVIDFAVTSNLPCFTHVHTCHALDSDHFPVILHLSEVDTNRVSKGYSTTNWEDFNSTLGESLRNFPRPNSIASIDSSIISFNGIVTQAAEHCTTPAAPPKSFHTLPKFIKVFIKQRNRARRKYQATYYPQDRATYLSLKKKVASHIRKFRSASWDNFVSGLEPGSRTYWRLVSTFSKPKSSVSPLQKDPSGGELVYGKQDKANMIADHLEHQFEDNPLCGNPALQTVWDYKTREIEMRNLIRGEDEIYPCSPREIGFTICKLKTRSAPGPDLISNRMLKAFPVIALVVLANIFNSCLRFNHFPSSWKQAIVSPILKQGKNPKEASSYRPISLVSTVGKLFEHIISNRLKLFQQHFSVLPDFQHGFRANLSTTHQLVRVHSIITKGFNSDLFTVAVFLDIAQAFDRVWHQGLVIKLHNLQLPNYLFRILCNSLGGRNFQVRVEDSLSTPRPMRAGVAQGTVLAPFLFSVFLSDFPTLPDTEVALYADDTALLCSSPKVRLAISNCQNSLTILESFFQRWRIRVNPSKSAAILFRRNYRKRIPPKNPLTFNNSIIPWSVTTRYLGITLDDRLSFKQHFQDKYAAAIKLFCALRPILGFHSKFSINSKLHIYKTVVRSALTYGSPLWAYLPDSSLYKLQVAQNRILRWIVGARWFHSNRLIHRDLDMPTILDFARKTAFNFFDDNRDHQNTAFAEAISYVGSDPGYFHYPVEVLERGSRPP